MKKKKIIVTLCSIFAFAAIAAGAFFITKSVNESANLSAAEFLAGHQWQKSGEETVVWTFETDGTCKVTTNSTEIFDCKWQIEDKNLKIETEWLSTLEDEFEISINASENSFKAVSKSDGKESTFVEKTTEQ